jgi:hypothetical protein
VAQENYFEAAEERLRSMRIREAVQLYEMAERAGWEADSCAGGRWICHMLLGNFENAWQESDAIAGRGKPDPQRFWDGRAFEGRRVLIRCLHGLGDTIQFIRYARLIRERAAALTIEAQPALKLLLDQSGLADQVITWGEPEPPWDTQMEVMELPRIFRTTLETIPAEVPYLDVPSVPRIAGWNGRRPLRVGIVWASSGYNRARSIPIELMAQLFDTANTRFFSLQAGEERKELGPWSSTVADLHDPSACVLATASKLQGLDLILTVDTMVAHLAGAMGQPVWTLLPFQCDWRWMVERQLSPWYPTMRLFRQPRPGDWPAVLNHVRQELDKLLQAGFQDASSCPQSAPGRVK